MPEFKLIEKLLYKSEQNDIEAEFIIGNETLWSSQKVIAEIFGTTSAAGTLFGGIVGALGTSMIANILLGQSATPTFDFNFKPLSYRDILWTKQLWQTESRKE